MEVLHTSDYAHDDDRDDDDDDDDDGGGGGDDTEMIRVKSMGHA